VKIGYSFWGFLGNGITDTPDGGRSHRRILIDGLAEGHDVVFLQLDRDFIEAGDVLSNQYRWNAGTPALDALVLEWRWPIPGRNTTWCGAAGHTCDLHRQHELLLHYTHSHNTPTIIWDKDRRLPPADPLRAHPAVTVCEPALHPSPGAVSLLFPVSDHDLDTADATDLASLPRATTLAYVGNQYDRDDQFARFFLPAAVAVPHIVAGKWPAQAPWPRINFAGRVPFAQVKQIHRGALATVLLLPSRYEKVGHITQRIFEAALAGCLPLMPANVRSADTISPPELIVTDGLDVLRTVQHLATIAGTPEHARLIEASLAKLGVFRLSTQLKTINAALSGR
jgi:hypothetical protein